MKRSRIPCAGALCVGTLLMANITGLADSSGGSRPAGSNSAVAVYEVTVTNLTPGQPLTPPILVTHRKPTGVFTVGDDATVGVQQIAENGNGGPLMEALAANRHVHDVVAASEPLVPADNPGGTPFTDSVTMTITSTRGAKYLSAIMMLICTNDGFTGIDAVRLPKKVGDQMTLLSDAYDAGTELNTEDFADLVPPCQGLIGVGSDDEGTGMSNPKLAEGDVIHHHEGIMGGNDLIPEIHGWDGAAVEITILRIE